MSAESDADDGIENLNQDGDSMEKDILCKDITDSYPRVGAETVKFLYFDNLTGYWIIGPEIGGSSLVQARCARSGSIIPDQLGGHSGPWEVWDHRKKEFIFDTNVLTSKCGL